MDFEKFHREESGRILATLIRLLGDSDLAEEMLQEAYAGWRKLKNRTPLAYPSTHWCLLRHSARVK
jgi:RNA polymerase sigma-70 factor (ECF subfamily)